MSSARVLILVVVLTDTFLKEVEKRALEFERYMDTALPQMSEMDDIIRTVWGEHQWKSRAQSVNDCVVCVDTWRRSVFACVFLGAYVSPCIW